MTTIRSPYGRVARQRALIALAVIASFVLGGLPRASASSTAASSAPGRIAFDRPDPQSPDDTFLFTTNVDGSHTQRLVATHTCCGGFSPNGSRLVMPRGTDDDRIATATVHADGTHYKALPLPDATLNIGCGTGSWSPDGAALTCEAWDDVHPARNGLYTIAASDGTVLRRVTSPRRGYHDIPGGYSPTGKRLVFVRFDPDGQSVGLFVVDVDGRNLHRLTAAGRLINLGAGWSPEGNKIVFSRHVSGDVRGSLWLIQANGSHLRPLPIQGVPCGGALDDPQSVGCHGPRWSPDGQHLVFAVNTATEVNIYTANADGSSLAQVTHHGGDDPDWGPGRARS
jgi:hypothetical protein